MISVGGASTVYKERICWGLLDDDAHDEFRRVFWQTSTLGSNARNKWANQIGLSQWSDAAQRAIDESLTDSGESSLVPTRNDSRQVWTDD